MKILFLDQSGKPGGAELCLLDTAKFFRDRCLVGLLADGPFKDLLEQHQIPVQILTDQAIPVRKNSGLLQSLSSVRSLITPIQQTVRISRDFDLIYANTQKALVVGAIASVLSRRPLVYHLHDIVSPEHFSSINCQLIVRLANSCATLVIANSKASQIAFVEAGGKLEKVQVIYNGFEPSQYQVATIDVDRLRQQLNLDDKFVVGHFSRLSPWKGQHVLIEALTHCPEDVIALLVGDALFGEHDYVEQLHHQVQELGLKNRVHFLGFRSDVPELMAACNLIAHTSTAPEPFGRVIVEAMLCGVPVVASAAGGAMELVETGKTGWLVPPGDVDALAAHINQCYTQPEKTQAIAHQAHREARQRFDLSFINHQINQAIQWAIQG